MSQNDPTQDAGLKSGAMIGVGEALGAYLWWGFITALYYKVLADLPVMELLAWRVFAGLPMMFILIAFPPGIGRLKKALKSRRSVQALVCSTALISVNWFTFIYAVLNDRLVEASLGYFINPLVSVLLARLILGERMRPKQLIAISIACAGAVVFCISFLTGADGEPTFTQFPWISFVLPASFSLYGLLRKQMTADSVTGLTIEMAMLFPVMLALEAWLVLSGEAVISNASTSTILLLILGGVVTVVPLVAFAAAARRLRLSTVGLLQYIAPTCQFLLAIIGFGEPFDLLKGIAFVLIWIAIIVYSIDSIRSARPPVVSPELET